MRNTPGNTVKDDANDQSGGFCIKKTFRHVVPFIACCLFFSYSSFLSAGPTAGNIVGGAGSINQAGLTTNINQLSHSLAID